MTRQNLEGQPGLPVHTDRYWFRVFFDCPTPSWQLGYGCPSRCLPPLDFLLHLGTAAVVLHGFIFLLVSRCRGQRQTMCNKPMAKRKSVPGSKTNDVQQADGETQIGAGGKDKRCATSRWRNANRCRGQRQTMCNKPMAKRKTGDGSRNACCGSLDAQKLTVFVVSLLFQCSSCDDVWSVACGMTALKNINDERKL